MKRSKINIRLLAIVFLCLNIQSCRLFLPTRKEPLQQQGIDQLVNNLSKSMDTPGLAVGIIRNGEIIYANAIGVQGLEHQQTLTTQSIFHMASVSKPFVATAILQLAEQGKLQLEDQLIDHLPYFKMKDDRYREITIQTMLNHTSGIPDTDDYGWENPQFEPGAVERYARSFDTVKLDFTPGTKYTYSNPAFDLLADVITKASGMTFEAYMKKYIFEPIGMKNSTFYRPDVPTTIATAPHILGDSLQRVVSAVYPYNRRHAGSSTLHSNIKDMLLWAQLYLNKGVINGQRIFSENAYNLLTTATHETDDSDIKVGLSWFRGKAIGSPVIFHQGGDVGYSSFFCFLPKEQSALVLMANTDDFWQEDAAAMLLANVLLDLNYPWGNPIHYELKDVILTQGIEQTKAVYFDRKENKPKTTNLSSGLVDDLGFWLLDRGHAKSALEVFLFNCELEPKDAGWVDSVADAYVAMDSTDQAIKWYQKALEMNPKQDFTQKKLDRLMGK